MSKNIYLSKSFLYFHKEIQSKTHILLEFDSPGYGDLIDIVPLVHSLLKRPVKKILIRTNKNDLPLQLIDRERVEMSPLTHTHSREYEVINFDNILKYNINCPTWIRFFIYSGMEELFLFNDPFPEADLQKEKMIIDELGNNYILFHSYNSRKGFDGRNTKKKNLELVRKLVRNSGFDTFDIGNNNTQPICTHLGGLSHDELFMIVKNCKGFIGIDSYPMHVAALYNKPIFGFFGSTHPFSVLPIFRPIIFVRNDKLDCLNCLVENKVESDVVKCSKPTEECKNIDKKKLNEKCNDFIISIKGKTSKNNYHLEYLRYIVNFGKSEFELQYSLELALLEKNNTEEMNKTLKRVLSPLRD